MKKLELLEKPMYQPTYRTQRESRAVYRCSPYAGRFGILRDAPTHSDTSWETFGVDSLPEYFVGGVQMVRKNIDRLQDLSTSYSQLDEKNLSFMIESLIQARRLIESTKTFEEIAQ